MSEMNEGVRAPNAGRDTAGPETNGPTPTPDPEGRPFENLFGMFLALFAATLAINELGAGKYGDDEIRLTAEKANAYAWYQSKSIKESLAEGQRDLLKSLLDATGAPSSKEQGMREQIASLEKSIERYGKEKKEILVGSKGVGPEGHSLDIDNEKGKVIGAREYEAELARLGKAGDQFDLGTLFLQISLVMGALGLLLTKVSLRKVFIGCLLVGGIIGSIFTVLGYAAV